ncbi:hypothetical protein J2W88_000580 [Acidovorax delafieldii]|uniref:Uncharacterized protein n=1 Tax=Acidovorax delafieldii TaxID=47920 RepID=A0AAJ2BN65_ACIDE|nr:hypothetical protein [Acidovorax delafieldii]MDR6765322.1 hypothetical protein [Acidovorax delafieldii]MDR6835760.1 hypothetical protein [Acidovorax delafieldii]MDR7365270.1 hypothetical protein [Acidovorax delafieldii]
MEKSLTNSKADMLQQDISVYQKEFENGNMAIFLTPKQVAFLADQWRLMPCNIKDEDAELWGKIAFRLMSALHKAGVEYNPYFPGENERYILMNKSSEA